MRKPETAYLTKPLPAGKTVMAASAEANISIVITTGKISDVKYTIIPTGLVLTFYIIMVQSQPHKPSDR